MQLGKVIGTVTATAKNAQLVGFKLLVCDVIDGGGKVISPGVVAADTVGAGIGDRVLITTGSAARLPTETSSAPIDAAIVAVVDQLSTSK